MSHFAGASSDFSHIAFSANAALTPKAVAGANPEELNLYEWINGQLRLVNILPDGSALPPSSQPFFGSPSGHEGQEALNSNFNHVVSPSGSRIFWTDKVDKELFARVNGTSTVFVSKSQKTNGAGPGGTDPLGPQLPTYDTAVANGSQVLFTSNEELTNDANTGKEDGSNDLYRYDMESGDLTDLTADPSDPNGAEVNHAVLASEDGSFIYFVANGVLAEGAKPGNCNGSGEPSRFCNLYVWHEGTGTRFIARMSDEEAELVTGQQSNHSLGQISPNGHLLVFVSNQSLTGYDNTVAVGTECAFGTQKPFKADYRDLQSTRLCTEVFRYNAEANSLVCISCNPTGGRPNGLSILPGNFGGHLGQALDLLGLGPRTSFYEDRAVFNDGRLFFDSGDALSPRDTNGQPDVYEFEPAGVGDCTVSGATFDIRSGGCVNLISGGFGPEPSMFMDASASGDDVFFATRDQLVSADRDEAVDVYDARVGGIPNTASPPACSSSDACKPGPTPQPSLFGAPASATFSGSGNVTPTSAAVVTTKGKSGSRSRAQRLAKALRACRSKSRVRRSRCKAVAQRRYRAGPASKKAAISSGRSSDTGRQQ